MPKSHESTFFRDRRCPSPAAALESQQVADLIASEYNGAVVSIVDAPADGHDQDLNTVAVAATPAPYAQILAEKDITLEIVDFYK